MPLLGHIINFRKTEHEKPSFATSGAKIANVENAMSSKYSKLPQVENVVRVERTFITEFWRKPPREPSI